jgi:hypothetical protein
MVVVIGGVGEGCRVVILIEVGVVISAGCVQ